MANKQPSPSALAAGDTGSYDSAEAAAIAGLRSVNATDTEYGGGILYNPATKKYAYTQPVGQGSGAHFGARIQLPPGWQLQALFHTHPSGQNSTVFSQDDIGMANTLKIPSYILPHDDNTIRRFDPGSKISRPDGSASGPKQSYSPGVSITEPSPQADTTPTQAAGNPTTASGATSTAPASVQVQGSSPAADNPYAAFADPVPQPTTDAAPSNPYAAFADPVSQPAPPPETATRVAGLTGRAAIEGVAQVEDTPRNVARTIDSLLLKGVQSLGYLKNVRLPTDEEIDAGVGPSASQGAAAITNAAGLPTPATAGERIYSSAVRALPTAAVAPEALPALIPTAAGGAASQAVAEAGGGPGLQFAAGLAAGGAPALGAGAAGLTRTLTRGAGAEAAAEANARIADAAANNVPLTAGQATGGGALQKLEAVSGASFGGGPIEHTLAAQNDAVGSRVSDIVDNLSGGVTPSPTVAGTAINEGVAAAKQSMKQAESAAYGKVDTLVPPTTPIDVSGTLAKLDAIATPTSGAEATTEALIPSKVASLRENLATDLERNADPVTGRTGALPYSAVAALRTRLGNSIDWGFSPADPVANGALKQVHGALTDDLNRGAAAVSPDAAQAVTDARTLYAANSATRDMLNAVVEKAGGPEAVYQAATNGTKQGATKIGTVMSALDPESQNTVRATVLDRLGRATPGTQNAAGDAFNASTYLTNWSKLAPEAKDALFGRSGEAGSLRASLDSLSKTVETLRNSGALKNPSGTAKLLTHSTEGAGASMALVNHLLSGDWHGALHIAGTAAAAVAGNNLLARALTNPRTARWLAQTTKMPTSAVPGMVNQLAKMGQATGDPDARDLAAALRAQQSQ